MKSIIPTPADVRTALAVVAVGFVLNRWVFPTLFK